MTHDDVAQITPILQRLGGALIEALPEWWSDATLRVEVKQSADGVAISHSIQSEQNPKDVVVGTDEIFTATRELQLLSERIGEPWSALVIHVQLEGEKWGFRTNFEYPDGPGAAPDPGGR